MKVINNADDYNGNNNNYGNNNYIKINSNGNKTHIHIYTKENTKTGFINHNNGERKP